MNKPPLDLRIFQKMRQLGLPDGQYVVVGGGVLVALGLLAWDDDIDVTVTQEAFDGFKNEGWPEEAYEDTMVIKNDIFDIGTRFGPWTLEELLADAMVIRGVAFMSPAKLLEWKQAANRPKDAEHIVLLKKYLKVA